MSHATAHLSLKNHYSAPDRPLLDSHYPSRGHCTPGYHGCNPRGRSYFPGQGSYGSPLKLLCQICCEQDTLLLSVSIGLIFSTAILRPLLVFLLVPLPWSHFVRFHSPSIHFIPLVRLLLQHQVFLPMMPGT